MLQPLQEASAEVALPALPEAAVPPVSAASQRLLQRVHSELVERAASPEAAAPARQASRYSDSLFRQPLISFFILSFSWLAGIEQNALQNKEFKHIA